VHIIARDKLFVKLTIRGKTDAAMEEDFKILPDFMQVIFILRF
jgi:hypothetical protein